MLRGFFFSIDFYIRYVFVIFLENGDSDKYMYMQIWYGKIWVYFVCMNGFIFLMCMIYDY